MKNNLPSSFGTWCSEHYKVWNHRDLQRLCRGKAYESSVLFRDHEESFRSLESVWSVFPRLDLESVREGVVVQGMARALSAFYPLAGLAVPSVLYSNSTSGEVIK